MTAPIAAPAPAKTEVQGSWLPLLIIILAQIQMGFNVTALTVSIGSIVDQFDTSATSVGTALVVYSLAVAGFVMLGSKLGKILGARLTFQVAVVAHGISMVLMALSWSVGMMYVAQALSGLAAAALVPTLVVLIASNYRGQQQAQALGLLAAAVPFAGVLAFLIAGLFGTTIGWRYSFWLIVAVAVVVFLLSFRLTVVGSASTIVIDWVGAFLAASAITLISLGFNAFNTWGVLFAKSGAPFTLQGLSPALLMVIVGLMFGQGFFAWSRRREAAQKSPLLPLAVLDSREERAATFSLLIIGALGSAVNFLIPLYIQIVQGRTSLQTAIATIPYSLAIFAAAALVVRLYVWLTPRQLGGGGFVVVSIGLTLLAYVIHNDWGTPLVIVSLLLVGLGEGVLITVVFNVLVSASPKRLAGDVGALRGTTNNLATGLGTALAGALLVGILSVQIARSVEEHPTLTPDLIEQVDLDNVDFISNDLVEEVLKKETTASPEQIDEAVRINTETRLQALKVTFLILAGLSMLAIIPARGLPPYLPDEVPSDSEQPPAGPAPNESASAVAD